MPEYQDPNQVRQSFDEFWIRNNLAFLARYWATASDALQRLAELHDQAPDSAPVETRPDHAAAVVAGHLEHHHYSGVLLTYAAFDEFMIVLTERLGAFRGARIKPSDLRHRGVKRYRKFIHQVCGLAPDHLDIDWPFLEDFAVVRNAIIHANGNRSHMSSPTQLNQVVDRRAPALTFRHRVKLVVRDEYVKACLATVRDAALSLNSATA